MENRKPEFTDEFCKYIFSEEEEKQIAQEMARKVSEIGEQRSMKKSVSKDFDGRIETLDSSINSLSRKLQDHYEMRSIRCSVEMDFDTKTVHYIRTDTGEVAGTRAMTAREVQMLLDFEVKMAEENGAESDDYDADHAA